MNSPEYGPFLKKLATIQSDAQPFLCHVRLLEQEKSGFDPRTAPVTECITAYFKSDQDEEKWFKENWTKFRGEAEKIEGVQVKGTFRGSHY